MNRSIRIDNETYELILAMAQDGDRSIVAQVRRLVNAEVERRQGERRQGGPAEATEERKEP